MSAIFDGVCVYFRFSEHTHTHCCCWLLPSCVLTSLSVRLEVLGGFLSFCCSPTDSVQSCTGKLHHLRRYHRLPSSGHQIPWGPRQLSSSKGHVISEQMSFFWGLLTAMEPQRFHDLSDREQMMAVVVEMLESSNLTCCWYYILYT